MYYLVRTLCFMCTFIISCEIIVSTVYLNAFVISVPLLCISSFKGRVVVEFDQPLLEKLHMY